MLRLIAIILFTNITNISVSQSNDCASVKEINLGFVDTSWTYTNKQLGVAFKIPHNCFVIKNKYETKNSSERTLGYGVTSDELARGIGQNKIAKCTPKNLLDYQNSIYFLGIQSEKENNIEKKEGNATALLENKKNISIFFNIGRSNHLNVTEILDSLVKADTTAFNNFILRNASLTNVKKSALNVEDIVLQSVTIEQQFENTIIYNFYAVKNIGCFDLIITGIYHTSDQQAKLEAMLKDLAIVTPN